MRNLSVRQVLTIGCLACVGAIVLLSESSTADSASAWLRAIAREIHLTCLEPSTQWLVVLGLLIYFVFFLWLARERNRNEVWWGLGNPDLWLCGLVLAGLVNYGLVHRTGWHGMQLIGLLAGMVLALAARSWAWRTGHGPDPRLVVRRLKLIITVVVTLLVCITLWQPELGSTYKYRGEVRWSGAWRNPNTYGLLMAVALVLTIGLFGANLAVPSGRRLRRLLFLVAPAIMGVVCALGLVKSYSRGAWVGAALGLVFLTVQCGRVLGGVARTRYAWARRNLVGLCVIAVSVAVLGFWQFRHTEWRPLRRLFSVANINDFSWRNRVVTYEGVLQMIRDSPLTGYADPTVTYDQLYSSPRPDQPGAMQLNDVLMLALWFGMPALLCFAVSIGLYLGCGSVTTPRGPAFPVRPGQAEDERAGAECSDCAVQPDAARALWILQSTRGAEDIALLEGFWFNRGLFVLATGALFWTFLMLAHRPGTGVLHGAAKSSLWLEEGRLLVLAAVCVTVLTAFVWASVRDPFRRIRFTCKTPDGGAVQCLCVLPKGTPTPKPVVVFAHGAGHNLDRIGSVLRCIAELGLAAVGLEYDKTNQANFDAQMRSVLRELSRRWWAQTNQVAWITHSLGAQRTLSFLATHPEFAPNVLVRLSGGWVPELEPILTNALGTGWALNTKVWLLHGEQDEVFPAAEVERLARLLRAGNTSVRVDILQRHGHNFGPDQDVLWRAAAEFCAVQFGRLDRIRAWPLPSYWYLWFPAGALWVILGARLLRRVFKGLWSGGTSPAVAILAVATSMLACAVTVTKVVLSLLPLTRHTAQIARTVLVEPQLRSEFDWMLGQLWGMKTRVGQVVDWVRLADLQRGLVKPGPDEAVYRSYVLSPDIGDGRPAINWRRPLWEYFFPRVRKESDRWMVTKTLARELRARVTISTSEGVPEDIVGAWRRQMTTPSGFEKLYVAALRAVGVPARLNENGQTEYWADSAWEPAPRPLVHTVIDPGSQTR
ncbi:MAG: O-antigen ligase family protein [Verrucomicrobiales bacterium]|nr:O-antigen ligase family protein [Verrucomicrobiales bacterium]